VKIVIIGQGYVGSALSISASKAGHTVIGFDTNPKVISSMNEKNLPSPNFQATNDEADIADKEVYIIAVPTPLDQSNLPDLSYLKQASQLIGRAATKGALVINESTSYPGTLREIVITEIEKVNKSQFLYASAPERIDPANTKWSIKNTPRILAGVNAQSTTAALEFYKTICDDVTAVSSPEVAESAKLFENIFRQVNIALVNELAQIISKLGISATEVIQAAATKPFGFMKFNPGLGVGGHCVPIDPIYLAQKAEELGAPAKFIRQANLVNEQMPLYVLQRLKELLNGSLQNKRICIIGLSYKADVSDLRQSPSLVLLKELQNSGANVFFHDEIIKDFNDLKTTPLTPNSFDLTLVAVRHSNLAVDKVISSAPIVFDCSGSITGAHHL
jgi:UDP-N-acetyl-D-glucosamine dehydrogenase